MTFKEVEFAHTGATVALLSRVPTLTLLPTTRTPTDRSSHETHLPRDFTVSSAQMISDQILSKHLNKGKCKSGVVSFDPQKPLPSVHVNATWATSIHYIIVHSSALGMQFSIYMEALGVYPSPQFLCYHTYCFTWPLPSAGIWTNTLKHWPWCFRGSSPANTVLYR